MKKSSLLSLYVGMALFALGSTAMAAAAAADDDDDLPVLSDERPLFDDWGKMLPVYTQMYLEVEKEKPVATEYGGNLAYSKLIRYPQLTQIWAGYPFSIDANEERGHFFIQADQMATARNNKDFLNTHGFAKFGGQPTACMNCHSGWTPWFLKNTKKELGLKTDKEAWIAFNSAKYWTMIKTVPHLKGVDHQGLHGGTRMGLTCNDCHNPKDFTLRLTRPALINALIERGYKADAKQGVKASKQEMRTLVCAQCHVEYYFRGTGTKVKTFGESIKDNKDAKWANGTQKTYDEYDEWRNGNKSVVIEAAGTELVFPWSYWKKGEPFRIEMFDDYYNDPAVRAKFPFDWAHKITKAPMLKMQHPETEMYSSSVHAANNVACADCHMPKVKKEGMKVTQHNFKSPLMNTKDACTSCHRGKSASAMTKQVRDIQRTTAASMRRCEYAIVSLIKDIAFMRAELGKIALFQTDGKPDDAKISVALKDALELQRGASIRGDFIGAENSTGFHSPREANRILAQGIEMARLGQVKLAEVALQYGVRNFKASKLGFEDIQKLNPGSIHFKHDVAGRKTGDRYYKEADLNGAAPAELMKLDAATSEPFNYKVVDKK